MFLKISKMAVFVLAASVAGMAAPKNSCKAWNDTFQTLDTSRWTVANGSAPGSSSSNTSTYESGNVAIVNPGVLRLTLTQVGNTTDGFFSYGALIRTNQKCGYGTYQWTMKMSSTALCADSSCQGEAVPGSVSAGFIYVNNSQTEIDFEFQGQEPTGLHLVNWLNTNTRYDPTGNMETSTVYTPFNAISGQHVYKFVWTKGNIAYYVDGQFVVNHTTNVPSAAAYFMINHWGTNSTNWGGYATPGTARYMYVTQASYTP